MFGMKLAKYELCKESKIPTYLQEGKEFFVVDMEKKKVYSSFDLRLKELSDKLQQDSILLVKECEYV